MKPNPFYAQIKMEKRKRGLKCGFTICNFQKKLPEVNKRTILTDNCRTKKAEPKKVTPRIRQISERISIHSYLGPSKQKNVLCRRKKNFQPGRANTLSHFL
jgi:hypothetical protein